MVRVLLRPVGRAGVTISRSVSACPGLRVRERSIYSQQRPGWSGRAGPLSMVVDRFGVPGVHAGAVSPDEPKHANVNTAIHRLHQRRPLRMFDELRSVEVRRGPHNHRQLAAMPRATLVALSHSRRCGCLYLDVKITVMLAILRCAPIARVTAAADPLLMRISTRLAKPAVGPARNVRGACILTLRLLFFGQSKKSNASLIAPRAAARLTLLAST
jgi:hypothetical protein